MAIVAIVAGVLLAAYLGVIVYALCAPVREHDPQRGQAVGCLMIVAIGLALLGGLLGLGVALDVPWLVTTVSVVVIYPAVMIVVRWAYVLVSKARGR